MAGNYADAPSWRMAYDRDGTQGYYGSSGGMTQLTQAQVQAMNAEGGGGFQWNTGGYNGGQWITLIFPEKRDIDAYALFVWGNNYSLSGVRISTDTTNGIDGTWTTVSSPQNNGSNVKPGYRTGIQQSSFLGVKAISWSPYCNSANYGGDVSVNLVHLYGEPVPGENPDRLEIWHPTLDQRVGPAYFDWGDTPRGSSATKPFRVKNISNGKTAQSVRVAMELLTDTTPTILSQEALTLDGSSWLAQVNVGDLAPQQISATVQMRRTTSDTAVMGLWSYRVFAESTAAWV